MARKPAAPRKRGRSKKAAAAAANPFQQPMFAGQIEAVETIEMLRADYPREYAQVMGRLDISPDEVEEWGRCAAAMHIPYEEGLGIHPQDDNFLDREVWDLPNTPDDVRPLLLHYHPLVIYRFQVLKQADVVLALFLQTDQITDE